MKRIFIYFLLEQHANTHLSFILKKLVVGINQDINNNVQPNNRNLCTASAGAACEDPPLIEFGKIVSGVKSGYEENDRVQYTCNPGYALSGSEWVTCHGKVWMPGPPQCLGKGNFFCCLTWQRWTFLILLHHVPLQNSNWEPECTTPKAVLLPLLFTPHCFLHGELW